MMKLVSAACCLSLLLLSVKSSLGQRPSDDSIFAPIPVERRARLAERLKLLVEYQVKQDWAKQYDLFSALRRRAEGKMDFIHFSQKEVTEGWKSPLVSFVPLRTKDFQPDEKTRLWLVLGCAKLKKKDKLTSENAMVEAYWERNDWFFSEVQMFGEVEESRCGQAW